MTGNDTIAAIATAPGKAGVAVVRISGPDAFEIGAKITGTPVQPGLIRYLPVSNLQDGRLIDVSVVLAFEHPHSYTGEDVLEVQCHGGSITPRRVLEAAFAAGARLAARGEFTERAFLNGKLDYDQAESVLDLINARTERAADLALDGLNGGREHELRDLYELAVNLSAELERSLDIDMGELPADFDDHVRQGIADLASRLDKTIVASRRRRIMRDGACVVLAGEPNAGKSSLMNALLEEDRAIVSEIPGTTRDSIEAWLDLDGFPVRLIDTAGLRQSHDMIESEGVRRAQSLIASADIVLSLSPDVKNELPNENIIMVHSKCDLFGQRPGGMNVSTVSGEGLAELKAELVDRLSKLEPHDAIRGMDALQQAHDLLIKDNRSDPILLANAVRSAACIIGEQIGVTYSADLLDRLFSRFCVGK